MVVSVCHNRTLARLSAVQTICWKPAEITAFFPFCHIHFVICFGSYFDFVFITYRTQSFSPSECYWLYLANRRANLKGSWSQIVYILWNPSTQLFIILCFSSFERLSNGNMVSSWWVVVLPYAYRQIQTPVPKTNELIILID